MAANRITRRLTADRGATLAEAAILTPLLVVLLFGVLEFGGAFRDYLTLNNTVTAAARQASIQGDDPEADYQIVQQVARSSAAFPASEIDLIVVYHPASPDAPPPAACLAGTSVPDGGVDATGACNVYTADALGWAGSSAHWGCGAGSADGAWCPTDRKTALSGPNGPPDDLGVYVRITHPYLTGLFGRSLALAKSSVIELEPQSRT